MIANSMQKVPVIIINYRTSHLIAKVVESIREKSIETPVVVLDNGSTPESFSALQLIEDKRILIIRSEKNLGFAGGANFAIQYILNYFKEITYCFLLNPDAICNPDIITGLMNILKSDRRTACISPQIINEDGKPGYSGGQIDYKSGTVMTATYDNLVNHNGVYEVDVFSGCAVLLDLTKIQEVGLFNENLFMYFDEADLSLKIKKAGYKILFTPQFQVHHDHSYTTRKTSFVKTYYMSRNRFKVFHNTMPFYYKVYFLIHEFAYHLKYRRTKNALYHLRGIMHYYSGKMGNGFEENKLSN